MNRFWKKALAVLLTVLTMTKGITPDFLAEEPGESEQDEQAEIQEETPEPAMTEESPEEPEEAEEPEPEIIPEEQSDTESVPSDEETPEMQYTPVPQQETDEQMTSLHSDYDNALDFSSMRLVVCTQEDDVIRVTDPVISSHNGVFLLQYESVEDTIDAYVYFKNCQATVGPDIMFAGAEESGDESSEKESEIHAAAEEVKETEIIITEPMTEDLNPLKQLEDQISEDEKESNKNTDLFSALFGNQEESGYTIALIDSGAAFYSDGEDGEKTIDSAIVTAVSMIGDNVYDDNGHGTNMLRYILAEDSNARVISIKALDEHAHGTVSSIYAAMEYAIENGVDIINLSVSAYSTEENEVIAEEVRKANEAGIIVVGSAGNDYNNVRYYVPGNIEEAVIAGSCDANGVKRELSNFGDTVDCNVVSESTSEAAARLSGLLSKNKITSESLADWYMSVRNRQGQRLFDAEFDGESYEVSGTGEFEGANITNINSFEAQFVSGAKNQSYSGYIWKYNPGSGTWSKVNASGSRNIWDANRSTAEHAFIYRVNYSMSVDHNVPARAIEIRVPLHLLRDRDGNYADITDMSVLSEEEYVRDDPENHVLDTDKYAYRIDGNEIVFTNMDVLNSAPEGYFEISYSTSKTTFNYRDMGSSDTFTAHLTANGLSADSSAPEVYINTTAEILSIEKRYPTKYSAWQSEWGTACRPANDSQYEYVIWEFYTTISDSNTQPYNLDFADATVATFGSNAPKNIDVVGFRYSGQGNELVSSHTIPNQTVTGYRYDYVVTKHLKSDVAPVRKYNIKNNVKATLTPIDTIDPATKVESSRIFYWEKPEYKVPTGHFIAHKRADGFYRSDEETVLEYLGMKAGEYSRYDLNEFKDRNTDYLDDLDYAVWVEGYPAPWTYKGSDPLNPANYFILPVKFELVDENVYLSQDGGPESSRLLTSEDFQIDFIRWNASCSDAELNEDTLKYDVIDADFGDNETLNLYVKTGSNSASWVKAAVLNAKTKEASGINSTYIKDVTDDKVTFNDNVIAYKLDMETLHYYLCIDTVPNMRLKSSDYVLSQIGVTDSGWQSIAVKNELVGHFYKNTSGNISRPVWKEIVSYGEEDKDFIREVQRDAFLSKEAVAASNNKRKKNYTITWKSRVNEQLTEGTGDIAPIPQASGTYFDLLPAGHHVNIDSVVVKKGKWKYVGDGSITAKVTENYKGTGRDLLIVHIDEPGDYYDLFFDTVISWDGINDYGRDVYNPIAYQTGNYDIKGGSANDGGTIAESALMSGLPDYNPVSGTGTGYGADNPNRYLYSEEYYDVAAITQGTSGLSKLIRAQEDPDYLYDTVTEPNGLYSYRMRFMNSFLSESKDIVLLDAMEYYRPDNGTDESDWRGTIRYVDTSQCELMGISPVIYYSTIEELDLELENNRNIGDASVWTRAAANTEAFWQNAGAKAIAVDLKKKTDGTDFVLGKGESVSVIVAMKAPGGAASVKTRIPVSYNNIHVTDTKISGETEIPFHIRHDYTSIRLMVKADITATKVAADTGKTIRNITFRLRGTSDYGNETDLTSVTNKEGKLSFRNIEMGTYILSEYEGTDDYLEDHTEHTVVIDQNGQVFIDGILYEEDYSYTLKNNPRIHADVRLIKRDLLSKAPMADITLKLVGTSDYGNDILLFETTDSIGRCVFRNVELGRYHLQEISTDENHLLPLKEWIVTVDEAGGVTVELNQEA